MNNIISKEVKRVVSIIEGVPNTGTSNLLCERYLGGNGCGDCPIAEYTGIQHYCGETETNVEYLQLLTETVQYETGTSPVNVVPCGDNYDVFVGVKLLHANITNEELKELGYE